MAELEPPLILLPYGCSAGSQFFCPCCNRQFSDVNDIVLHLSSDRQCGRWAAEALPALADTDQPQGSDYSEDEDTFDGDIPDPFEDEEGNVQTAFLTEINNDHINHPSSVSSACLGSAINHHQRFYHPNPPASRTGGMNLLQRMEMDQHAPIRNSENVYFPFASKSEWELADWLSSSALSQKDIDTYLHLERNTILPVSFKNAKDLCSRIESLPDVPRWRYQEIKVENYQTKSPIILYWRDGLEVVEHLFSNPVFAQCMDISPYKEFEGQERVYGEFMSADDAWHIQVSHRYPVLISGSC
ncbi:hypothetical protein EDD16DRAFT_1634110 [Pisolithus croceorrhizus]|nr:hypothetical protein EDD16DRAFT_1634110 [Pisolithus croceorrhizus]